MSSTSSRGMQFAQVLRKKQKTECEEEEVKRQKGRGPETEEEGGYYLSLTFNHSSS